MEISGQHPIPQQVSSYQFKLVGDMTLKQFFQVGGGALIALIIYSSEIISFIKWPLIVVSILFGVVLAFFPFEDRPLDKWIVLFFKSIYSPTLFSWIKGSAPKSYFQPTGTKTTTAGQAEQTEEEKTKEIEKVEKDEAIIEKEEKASPAPVGIQKEATEVLEGLEQGEEEFLTDVSQQLNPTTVSQDNVPDTTSALSTDNPQTQNQQQISTASQPTPPPNTPTVKETVSTTYDANNPNLTNNQPAVQQKPVPIVVNEHQIPNMSSPVNPPIAQTTLPETPTRPNIVVGQVLDEAGKEIQSAIIDIRDSDGRPARAIRSDTNGHFQIVTPLSPGKYVLNTEREGFTFEPFHLEINDQIIQPIIIKAKERNENEK